MSSLAPTISLPSSLQPERSPSPQQVERFRIIAFDIAGYTFALPIMAIAKVIHCPPLNTPGLGPTGLIHLDQQIIRVLNLHDRTNEVAESSDSSASSQEPRFLVVARQENGNLCGIPVDAPPDLLEIERSQVRSLPQVPGSNPMLALSKFAAVLPRQPQSPNANNAQGASSVDAAASDLTILFLSLEKAQSLEKAPASL